MARTWTVTNNSTRSRQKRGDAEMAMSTLEDLFIHELKDIYNAKKQILKALPKMAKAASSRKLRDGFQKHLKQTEGHVKRLEQVFEGLGKTPRGTKCLAMEGIIEEGKEVMKEDFEDESVMDAALIAAAQRVEHYEIAAYGTVRSMAALLGHNEAEELLQQTLDEEKETDQKLSELAESEINVATESK